MGWHSFWNPGIVVYNEVNQKSVNPKYRGKRVIVIGAQMETSGKVKSWHMNWSEGFYVWIRLTFALLGLAR